MDPKPIEVVMSRNAKGTAYTAECKALELRNENPDFGNCLWDITVSILFALGAAYEDEDVDMGKFEIVVHGVRPSWVKDVLRYAPGES